MLNVHSAGFLQNLYFGSCGFWDAVHTIGEIPLAADQQVPKHLHENHARRSIDSSADRTVQTREKDAFEYFFPADSLEICPRILAIERTAARAATVGESAIMT